MLLGCFLRACVYTTPTQAASFQIEKRCVSVCYSASQHLGRPQRSACDRLATDNDLSSALICLILRLSLASMSATATANDPFAFGDDTQPSSAAAPTQSTSPTPTELAAAIQAEKRKRLAASLHRAADLLDTAHILILHTGAGWSADSGLPTYRDAATHPAMQARSLTYRDICDPRWLAANPQLFVGFWGQCFNQYRDVVPHDGYGVVRRWREERFGAGTDVARRIGVEMERLRQERKRRRRERRAGEQLDEEDVVMQRDKGIVHPPEQEMKEDEQERKDSLSAPVQMNVTAEAERVHITSSFTLRENDEVRYSAAVDSSTAEVAVATTEADGDGVMAAQSLSVSSETTAIHTPHDNPTTLTASSITSAADPPPAAITGTTQAPLPPPGWAREDDDFVRTAYQRHVHTADEEEEGEGQSESSPAASAFFALTSNVDAHFHRAGFEPHELYELHGNSETWQCSELCSFDTWTAPPHFRFTIDQSTLLAPHITPPPLSSIHISTDSDDDDTPTPTHPSSAYWTPSSSFATNVPRCPLGHLARPNILMFNDSAFLRPEAAEQRYLQWMHAVLDVLDGDGGVSAVVLEVGCGLNVPTVRWRSESVWAMMRQRRRGGGGEGGGGEVGGGVVGRRGLIRVNVWESRIDVEGKDEDCVSVELGGLAFVRIVDRLLDQKKRSRRQKRKADDDSAETTEAG